MEGGAAFWPDSCSCACCSGSLPCTCTSKSERWSERWYRNAVSSIWLFQIVGNLPCGTRGGPACHLCLTVLCNFVFLEKKFRIFWTASMPALKNSKQCCQGSSTTSVPKHSVTWVSSHYLWFLRNTAQIASWDVTSFFHVVIGKREEHLEKQIVTNRMIIGIHSVQGNIESLSQVIQDFCSTELKGGKKRKKIASLFLLKHHSHIITSWLCV